MVRGRRLRRRPAQAGLTAALLAAFGLRACRLWEHRESVFRFYYSGASPFWTLVETLMFLGPFAVALAAALAVWLRGTAARRLGCFCCVASGFFVFEEGLTVFARCMTGSSGYVGASPTLSAAVCLLSGLTLCLRFRRTGQKK